MPGGEAALRKELERLEEDWNSYKKSMPRHGCCSRAPPVTARIAESFGNGEVCGLHLLSTSPKKLLSSLQDPSRGSFAAGAPADRIQGRNLLEDLEIAKDDTSPKPKDETTSSACSSVLVDREDGREATEASSSSCSCTPVWYSSLTSSCSSSSSSASASGEEEEEVVLSAGRESSGGRWDMRRMIRTCSGLMVLTMVLAVIVMMFAEDGQGDYMVPT